MKSKLEIHAEAMPKNYNLLQFWGLMRWSLIRHKYLLPTFSIAQAALALAIVYGLALLIPEIDEGTSLYLSSGAITLGIIAVGCVLAAQIVNTAKQDGIVKYQKTLPVNRMSILIADIIIWGIASLPGILMSCLAAMMRFNISINVSLTSILIILLAQVAMISIGFAIAYWLPSNFVALVTQIIMIGGLLFSPITYPADRLPDWMTVIYNVLPFVPTSNLIRATLFGQGSISFVDLFVVIIWALFTFGLSLFALSRKE